MFVMSRAVVLALFLSPCFSPVMADCDIYQAVARDDFPVFDNPTMLSAVAAEAAKLVFAQDAVIGVAHNGEARAYPIAIMGVHELGNDHIAGVPISIGW